MFRHKNWPIHSTTENTLEFQQEGNSRGNERHGRSVELQQEGIIERKEIHGRGVDNSELHNDDRHKKSLMHKVFAFLETRLYEHGESMIAAHLNERHRGSFTRNRITFWGVAMIGLTLSIFIDVFYTSFHQAYVTQKFLAVDESAGECASVSKVWSINGVSADYYGFWFAESNNYVDSDALYHFNFNSLAVTDGVYLDMMSAFEKSLIEISKRMQYNNLAVNLVIWVTWTSTQLIGGAKQHLMTTSDANYVVLSQYYAGAFGSERGGDCEDLNLSTSFDISQGILSISMNTTLIRSSAHCNSSLNLPLLGYHPEYTGVHFRFSINVMSLFSAISVNYGVQPLNYYTTVGVALLNETSHRARDNTVFSFEFNGVIFDIVRKFDPFNHDMETIYCIGPEKHISSGMGWNCVVRIGYSYAIPFFQHIGYNTSRPSKCTCSDHVHGTSTACNSMNFLAGALVYDHSMNSTATDKYPVAVRPFIPLMELFYVMNRTAAEINELVYEAAWTAYPGQGEYVGEDRGFSDARDWRAHAYKFSKVPSFGAGSIIVWGLFSVDDHSISKNKYQLTNGACSTAIYSPNFHSLYDDGSTFATLQESYLVCTMTLYDSTINALGVSLGLTASLAPIPFLILLYAIWFGDLLYAHQSSRKHAGKHHPPGFREGLNADDGGKHDEAGGEEDDNESESSYGAELSTSHLAHRIEALERLLMGNQRVHPSHFISQTVTTADVPIPFKTSHYQCDYNEEDSALTSLHVVERLRRLEMAVRRMQSQQG